MAAALSSLRLKLDSIAPEGSTIRKLLQLISLVLLFEGISVIILFSYVGLVLGIASIVIGIVVFALLVPKVPPTERSEANTLGIRLVDSVVHVIGGEWIVFFVGFMVVVVVFGYNAFLSSRSELGDLDTLTLLFGFILMSYPFLAKKFKSETCFAMVFTCLVVIFLVVPQALASGDSDGSSSGIGGWYVHYMLAAPFAGILDLIGIDASSSGNIVTLEFRDGSSPSLQISAYCAGLYSFSIFLAAFFSFVLVFETLPRRTTAVVLALGIIVAYLGNLFRMVVIGVVGYYRGMDALMWAHENVGWIVFLSWSAVFWYLILGYAGKRSKRETPSQEVS